MAPSLRILAILVLMPVAWQIPCLRAQPLFEQTDVFVGGQDGINTYRIPALICTKKGTLLAFSEGRKDNSMDGSPTDLVLKRSLGNVGAWSPLTGGHPSRRSTETVMTWQPMQILIHSLRGEAYMNPVPVIDRTDGTIYLLVNDYPPPWADVPADIWLMRSKDEGATWSAPIDITATVGRKELGPGTGIQLRSGRIMVPAYDGVVFSDDHGKTWNSSGKAGGTADETQVVELVDGSLILNRRGKPNRILMISRDKGESWGEPFGDPALVDSGCQGSLIRYTRRDEVYGTNRLLFANPADPRGRFNVTVRLSYDEGKSWPVAKVIKYGPGAYSSMTVFPDGSIGIIYETGEDNEGFADPYAKLAFARFNLEWLTEGKDHLDRR